MESLITSGIKSLYKFKSFDKDNFYQDILKNILYFPSPSQLNDPFDSKIPIRYDLCSKDELYDMYENLSKKFNPHLSRSERRESARETVKKIQKNLKNNPDFTSNHINQFSEKIGIFSLTEKLDNLLLWSHYSAAHKGFCVEFSASKLFDLLVSVFLTLKDKAFIFKVRYQNDYPIIHPINQSYRERLELQFCTKSIDWKYEDEWRIIFLDRNPRVEIDKEIITNIYFGLLASEENINKSIEILKVSNPEINLYKAVKKKDAFGLNFEKLGMN